MIRLLGREISYVLRRSERRSLGLKVDGRGLTVAVPLRTRLSDVEAFIHSHAAWVCEKLDARAGQTGAAQLEVADGACVPLLGSSCTLRLTRGANRARWHDHGALPILELALREDADPRPVLLRGLQARALAVFSGRVEEFVFRLGLTMPAVRLTDARTRWGSCSARSGIRLHWRLIHLPLELVDYVVAHEVAHLVEMNHSPRFWAVVGSLYPGYEAARAALRKVRLPEI